jgi:hypothetical protein
MLLPPAAVPARAAAATKLLEASPPDLPAHVIIIAVVFFTGIIISVSSIRASIIVPFTILTHLICIVGIVPAAAAAAAAL